MSNELQAAVRWVAEGAGETVPIDVSLSVASGTLDSSEVGLVLGWLAKTGYVLYPRFKVNKYFYYRHVSGGFLLGSGDTLHAALESALVALHEGAK